MKRDMELVRRIAMSLEACEDPEGLPEVKYPDSDQHVVDYHVGLMVEAGLVDYRMKDSCNDNPLPQFFRLHLTWSGHEFTDLAQSSALWSKVASRAAGSVGKLSFDLMLSLLKNVAAQQLGLPS